MDVRKVVHEISSSAGERQSAAEIEERGGDSLDGGIFEI